MARVTRIPGQHLRESLMSLIEAVEREYRIELDRGFMTILVNSVRTLLRDGVSLPCARSQIFAAHSRERDSFSRYEDVLDLYFSPQGGVQDEGVRASSPDASTELRPKP